MRTESPIADQAEARFTADLRAALSRQGIRGAYAEKLRAEWQEHYASLRQEMSPTEACARLGSPEELAAAAARIRFAGKFWCQHPVLFGSLMALGLFLVVSALSLTPVIVVTFLPDSPSHSLVSGYVTDYNWFVAESSNFKLMNAYVEAFNWLGAAVVILLAFWLTGRFSSPPRFRIACLSVFSASLLLLTMEFNPPLKGPGSGSFLFGALAPDYGSSGQFLIWLLILVRVGIFAWVVRQLRRTN